MSPSPAPQFHERHAIIFASLLLAALIFAVYGQSLDYGFLVFDDRLHIYGNEAIVNGLTQEGLAWALTTFDRPYYMPLTRLSFMLDVTFFGLHPEAMRAVNVILHGLNSLWVYLLVTAVVRRRGVALVVAALFAVHPQHVEAVAWISQRKELLAGFFGLLSTLFYVVHAEVRSSGDQARQRFWYALSLLAFLFSLTAKPTWIVFPVLLVLLDYWRASARDQAFQLRLRDKLPYLVIALVMFSVHLGSAGLAGTYNASIMLADVPLVQRLYNVPVVLATYLGISLVPVRSSIYFIYPLAPFAPWIYVGSTFVLFMITGAVWMTRRRVPALLFGWFWFLIALVPVIGLVGAGEAVFIGDRWSYLPHVGLLVALVLSAETLVASWPTMDRAFLAVLAGIIFAVIAWMTVPTWADDGAYWERTLAYTRGNHFAHFKMSDVLAAKGDGEGREQHLRKALNFEPGNAAYLLNLVIHLQNTRRHDEAHTLLERMLELDDLPVTYAFAMGRILLFRGELERSRRFLTRALNSQARTPSEVGAQSSSGFVLAALYAHVDRPERSKEILDGLVQRGSQPTGQACKQFRRILTGFPPGFPTGSLDQQLQEACSET
jgi:tetratricopeptide (TPR) repeat protein